MPEMEANKIYPRRLPALLLAAGASVMAVQSYRLGLGEARMPGPGFFPFWLSLSLAVLAVAISFGVGGQAAENGAERIPAFPKISLQSFLSLALYCALLIPLGFFAATFLFFSSQARIIEGLSWTNAALRGTLAAAATFVLFHLLGVQLPAGLWLE